MRTTRLLCTVFAALALTACSSDGAGSGNSGGSGGSGGDATGSDGGDDAAATSDTTEEDTGPAEIVIPDCQFSPPVGAKCNPYPECPGSGCPGDQICTLTETDEGIRRIECAEPGDVSLGGTCDYVAGTRCAEGLCIDGQCRGFCNGVEHCPDNASCVEMQGPIKATVCTAQAADCDPLDATDSCPAGLACYLNPGTGITDCLPTKGGGGQNNACDCQECCNPGLTCATVEGQQVCGQTCLLEEGGACSSCPAETATKAIDDTYGVCVPQGEDPPDPPDPIPCDILAQDCESAAQACYPTNKGDQCLVKGNKAPDADCQGINDCQTGSYCHASGKCKRLCDKSDGMNSMCESGVNAKCSPIPGSAAGFCDE